jgi:hypothetical protein
MLACLCPLKSSADESLHTLHFASMVCNSHEAQSRRLHSRCHSLPHSTRSRTHLCTPVHMLVLQALRIKCMPVVMVDPAVRLACSSCGGSSKGHCLQQSEANQPE